MAGKGDTSGIRAGRAYVEIGGNDTLDRALRKSEARLRAFGDSVGRLGLKLTALGAALAAPLAVGAKSFAIYEQALADLRAAANPTAAEFDLIKQRVNELSAATGKGPADVAAAFTELLKAGLGVQQVLGGAGEAALKFSRVAGMEVAEAATVMVDAMSVFKEGPAAVGDALSQAADASTTGVKQIAEAMSMSSAVAGQTGQSLRDLSAAIGIMASAGVKGSDAGTSLKTMLLSLAAPTDTGARVIEEFGLSVRDATGKVKPMRALIEELQGKLGGLDLASRDRALKDLFGTDAIRAGMILMGKGVKGWDEFNGKMGESLGVGAKFDIMADTTQGALERMWAALQRTGNAVHEAFAGEVRRAIEAVTRALGAVAQWATENRGTVIAIAAGVAGVAAAGAALIGVGVAAKGAALAFGFAAVAAKAVLAVLAAVVSPVGLVVAGLAALAAHFLFATETGAKALAWLGERFEVLRDDALDAFRGVTDALAAGDWRLAAQVLWAVLQLEWERGVGALKSVWVRFKHFFQGLWIDIGDSVLAATFDTTKFFLQSWERAMHAWRGLVDATGNWIFDNLLSNLDEVKKKELAFIDEQERRFKESGGKSGLNPQQASEARRRVSPEADLAKQRQAAAAANDAKLQEELNKIQRAHDQAMADLRQMHAADKALIDQERDKEIAEQQRKVDDLKQQLEELRRRAAEQRQAGEAEPFGPPPPPGVPAARAPEEVAAAVADAIGKTVAVRGTFNAGAVAGLGRSGPVEKTARNTERLVKLAEEERRRARQNRGAAFT